MQTRVTLGKQNLARYSFNSLRELGTYINETPTVWTTDDSQSVPADYSWDLCAGYDGAVNMARTGWVEGAQRTQKALKAFAPLTPTPQLKNDIVGYRPNIPRYLAGVPNHMVRRVKRGDTGQGRVLTLAVSVVANSFTSAHCMSNFGVAVAQYINQLERSGIRVHLIGTFAVERNSWRLAVTWTIKHAGQPLDLSALAFAIGHPAMLRRIGLAMMERQSDTPQMSAYGSAMDARASDLIDAPNGTIILNGMKSANTHAATPEAALAYVSEQIAEAQKARRAA